MKKDGYCDWDASKASLKKHCTKHRRSFEALREALATTREVAKKITIDELAFEDE